MPSTTAPEPALVAGDSGDRQPGRGRHPADLDRLTDRSTTRSATGRTHLNQEGEPPRPVAGLEGCVAVGQEPDPGDGVEIGEELEARISRQLAQDPVDRDRVDELVGQEDP